MGYKIGDQVCRWAKDRDAEGLYLQIFAEIIELPNSSRPQLIVRPWGSCDQVRWHPASILRGFAWFNEAMSASSQCLGVGKLAARLAHQRKIPRADVMGEAQAIVEDIIKGVG